MSADVVCPARSPLFRPPRELEFGSDASIALTAYLAGRANGAAFDGPAIKR